MIIDCISDLHGYYPELEGGDLLIVAGDIELERGARPALWLEEAPYKKVIWIAGNHDNVMYTSYLENEEWLLQAEFEDFKGPENNCKVEYLCDFGTEFEGLKIWGSPWTKRFEGMNPKCMAFTVKKEEELAKKWALIPNDVDILVTHCPPVIGKLDLVNNNPITKYGKSPIKQHVGSLYLTARVDMINPTLHIFGHIHEGYGNEKRNNTIFVNGSYVNEYYEPVNKPIRIKL